MEWSAVLALAVFAFPIGAQETPVSEKSQAADKLPPEVLSSRFMPLRDRFGYDPDLASKIYGRKLSFINFDPAGFTDTKTGRAARVALGHFLTHTTSDLSIPLWARLMAHKKYGDLPAQLRDLGLLPSPYRYQLDGKVSYDFEVIGKNGKQIKKIAMPYQLSVNEAVYAYEDKVNGKNERNVYFSRNCLTCHAGVYGNYVIGGAPNKNYNIEWDLRNIEDGGKFQLFATTWRFSKSFARQGLIATSWLKAAGAGIDGQARLLIDDAEGDHLVNGEAYFKNVIRKASSSATNETVGAQMFPFVSFTNLAHLKPQAATLDDWEEPAKVWKSNSRLGKLFAGFKGQDGQSEFALVQSRPWWLARYSGFHFWYNMTPDGPVKSAGDLAAIQSIAFHGNKHTTTMKERFEMQVRLQSYIRETQSPAFPGMIDYERATRGLGLYNQSCAKCHGRIKRLDKSTGMLTEKTRFALHYDQQRAKVLHKVVGTDDTYYRHMAALRFLVDNALANGEAKKYSLHIRIPSPNKQPYIYAPPLVGLWASGPYFHNGSVPNVYLVLNSKKRPKYWQLDPDPYAIDLDKLGVVFEDLRTAPKSKTKPLDWLVYDTTHSENGMSNVGHTFGDALTDTERFAVIELLKTLDTKRVDPKVIPAGSS